MRPPIKVKHGMEKLTTHSGLIYIGTLLKSLRLKERLDNLSGVYCENPAFSHSDVLFSMTGLNSVGNPYFMQPISYANSHNFLPTHWAYRVALPA